MKRRGFYILGAPKCGTTSLAVWLFIPQYCVLATAGAGAHGLILRHLPNLWFWGRTLGVDTLRFALFMPPRNALQDNSEVS